MQDFEIKCQKMQKIITKIAQGQNLINVAYDATSEDDILTLQILKESGFNFLGNNYIFTAVNCYAKKCLEFLLKEGAEIKLGGKAQVDGKIIYFEPIELACITNNIDALKIFIENGVKLQTFGGIDVLRRYKKEIGAENTKMLKSLIANKENIIEK